MIGNDEADKIAAAASSDDNKKWFWFCPDVKMAVDRTGNIKSQVITR